MLHKFFMVRKQKLKGKRDVVLELLRNKIKERYTRNKGGVGYGLDGGNTGSETVIENEVMRRNAEHARNTSDSRDGGNVMNRLDGKASTTNKHVNTSNKEIPHHSTIHHTVAIHPSHLRKLSSSLRTIYRFNSLKNRKTLFNRSRHIIENITKRRVDWNDLRKIKWLDGRYTFAQEGDDLVVCGVGGVVDGLGGGMAALYDGDVVVDVNNGNAVDSMTGKNECKDRRDETHVITAVSDSRGVENTIEDSRGVENTIEDSRGVGNTIEDCKSTLDRIRGKTITTDKNQNKSKRENASLTTAHLRKSSMNISTNKESAHQKYQRILDRIKTRECVRKMQFIAQQDNEASYSFRTDLINTFNLESRTCYEYEELKSRMNYVCDIEEEIRKVEGFAVVNRNGRRYVMRKKE
ncbi:hypothetical protein THOM_2201 [Trachipleistophora hominis]|uniref:Uncharacterized protein n=1 Tax=Trachipleistophora hominis TaxID=72359 RepID=L7JVT9_TRAHO|nr:hypothetical protein THOM_2201 [Trachipleistophora hominis]